MTLKIDKILEAQDKKLRNKEEPWIGIIIHHTGVGGREEIPKDLWERLYKNIGDWLVKKDDVYASAHYLIGREGELTRLVNEETHIAYHAGISSFWHPLKRKWMESCNSYFIGIELIGDGNIHSYSFAQYQRLIEVCQYLKIKYKIQSNMIIGHEMVAPSRKNDPGELFDWLYFFDGLEQANGK
jgi:N-acetyl-anhydromuramyl-L-alanine amidase AmpD